MGLLDEAIRDHLDLKRRRGADPAELERAEREALGPVRRKGDVAAIDYDDQEELFDDEPDQELESSDTAYDEGWDYSDEPPAGEAPPADEEPEPEPHARGRRSRSAADDDEDAPRGLAARFGLRRPRHADDANREADATESDEPLDEDEPTRLHSATDAEADRGLAEPIESETTEHDVAETTDGEGDKDDDMLEETPEFLQDTPDHDRLWFEQRPPRDFDFDN